MKYRYDNLQMIFYTWHHWLAFFPKVYFSIVLERSNSYTGLLWQVGSVCSQAGKHVSTQINVRQLNLGGLFLDSFPDKSGNLTL